MSTTSSTTSPPDPPRVGVLLVRNDARHDARVARAAAQMAAAGLAPVIVAVTSAEATERRGRLGGWPVLRLQLRRAVQGPPRPAPAPVPADTSAPVRPRGAARLRRLLSAASFHRQAFGAVRALRPALVHCNDHNTMWTGVLARLALGTRVLYDAHELWPDRNGRWEWRPWLLATEALFVRVADAVVTASPGYADEMAARYRVDRPAVVLNVPAARATGPRPARPGRPALVYVGGLMPGRGLEVALRALAAVPEARLDLIGPGRPAYVEHLRALAGAAGVADRVAFVAPVAPEAVVDRLAGYDAGLSLIEPICRSYELTMPNKLFEYLAAGVGVLAGDVPTQAAYVREAGAGVVVALRETDVAAAIRRVADRPLTPTAPPDPGPVLRELYAALLAPKRRSCSRAKSRYSDSAARRTQ